MEVSKLNEERKRQKLSIEEVSIRANLPKSTVEKVLFGIVKTPRIDTMQAIERALGFTDSWTEEEKALGVGNHPIVLTERENDWVITLNEAEETLGEQYVATVIQMVKLNIKQKAKN